MLNSRLNEPAMVDLVRPDDGRLESFWVALFIFSVLLLGGLGILARQEPALVADPSASLNQPQRQLLLELSITAEEIEFAGGVEGIELPVFFGQKLPAWQEVSSRCFLLRQPNSSAAFVLQMQTEHLKTNHPAIFFTPELAAIPNSCNQLDTWLRMDNHP
ncbi:MAG TPA: hypothetical protein VJY63_11195 [Marinospirillum sp.]|uniref:hypothetical protein n=1 Tax=Marinospirillum sp. TaxID=2183934 RepID=UPI002B47D78A|nr:hypothetical protein [Marinospirillum sp.]HKM16467.1 hypothetical protein [Marinospirillum sp.]